MFERSLKVLLKEYSGGHADAGLVAGNLAIAYAQGEEWTKAEPLFRNAFEARPMPGEASDPQLGKLLEWYATDLRNLGRYSEAAQMDALSTGIRVRHAIRTERIAQRTTVSAPER